MRRKEPAEHLLRSSEFDDDDDSGRGTDLDGIFGRTSRSAREAGIENLMVLLS